MILELVKIITLNHKNKASSILLKMEKMLKSAEDEG